MIAFLLPVFLSVGNALGPVYAGAIYDEFGSYRWFLWTIIPFVVLGAILMTSLGAAPDHRTAQK